MNDYTGFGLNTPPSRRTVADLTAAEVDRFWSKVRRSTPEECWLWAKSTNNAGYGRFETWKGGRRQRFLAHRVAYELVGNMLPGNSVLLHECDTPACCNPSHLRPGTQAENIADARVKGRMVPPPRKVGEAAPRARLSPAKAAEIRRRYQAGGVTQRALAAEFGVDPTAISQLVRGKTWAEA